MDYEKQEKTEVIKLENLVKEETVVIDYDGIKETNVIVMKFHARKEYAVLCSTDGKCILRVCEYRKTADSFEIDEIGEDEEQYVIKAFEAAIRRIQKYVLQDKNLVTLGHKEDTITSKNSMLN